MTHFIRPKQERSGRRPRQLLPLFLILLFIWALILTLGSCEAFCSHPEIVVEVIPASCTEGGYTLHRCTSCTYQYKSDYSFPTDHVYTKQTVPPTCESSGQDIFTCQCGHSYSETTLPPIDHIYEMRTVAAQCETPGYTEFFCIYCDNSHIGEIFPAKGHLYTHSVTAPTCSAEGYTEYDCVLCDASYRTDYTDPTDHHLVTVSIQLPSNDTEGHLIRNCTDCDFFLDNRLLFSHVYGGGYVQNTTPLARGIDLSCYQHKIPVDQYLPLDWNAIKAAGIDFAIIKAGSTSRIVDGVEKGGIDPTFEMDYRDAKAAGLDVGLYFYTYATTPEEIEADAQLLLGWMKGKQFEYPIYFDLEEDSIAHIGSKELTEFAMSFISILRENGYYGALYCNHTWLTKHVETEPIKGFCDVWYARCPHSNPVTLDEEFHWNFEKYGGQLGMWQYSHYGIIDGIEDTYFDLNYAYRDYPSLIKRFGLNGYAPKEQPE